MAGRTRTDRPSPEHSSPVLRFETPVPRRFVHRRAVAEVFLTDCIASDAPDTFVLGAQWPRLHGFYRSHTRRHDTMLLVETLRQATIYLAHTRYRVPLGHPFVMHTLRVDATPERLLIGDRPAELTINADVGDRIHRNGTLAQFSVTYVCRIDGTEIGRGVGTASVFTPAAYSRLRWGESGPRDIGAPHLPDPIATGLVGQFHPDDVVLGASRNSDRWVLRIDDSHPILFDHPGDHVPGMLILEAFRQGARAMLRQPCADIETIEVAYHRFAEIDVPATVVATPAPDDARAASLSIEQWGRPIATGRVRLASNPIRL